MAKLIVRSDRTGAEIVIAEDGEGYGGTCSSDHHPGHGEPSAFRVHHHRLTDAIELAEIHMDIWHDKEANA